ncbi:DUF4283 domain-containing protein, partial [Shigella flexneri]|nr:DUF4283 domain-containing protein [Shigella flexneri]
PSPVPLKQPGSFKGEPAITFSEEEMASLNAPFRLSLVGKFTLGRPALTEIRKIIISFGLKAEISIGLLDQKHVLLRCSHEEDFQRIWLREL